MTRKDYNKIADAINSAIEPKKKYDQHQIAVIIANALKGTNPNYDSARFYNACVYGRRTKNGKEHF